MRPREFFTDTPPPRLIGTECEQDVLHKTQPGVRPIHEQRDGIHKLIASDNLTQAGFRHVTGQSAQWLANGAKLMIDVRRIEYATPECEGPAEATAATDSGEIVMKKIMQVADPDNNFELYRRTGIMSENDAVLTMGYHTNFLIPAVDDRLGALLSRILPLHLATQSWGWAGMVNRRGFSLSQKVFGIRGPSTVIDSPYRARRAIEDKPIMVIRRETHDDTRTNEYTHPESRQFERLELRCPDYTPSQEINFLHLAATSLVARLAEHPRFISSRMYDLSEQCTKPDEIMRKVSQDLSLQKPIAQVDGIGFTAIHTQMEFIECISQMSQHVDLPEDELAGLALWQTICELMETAADKGIELMADRIGWAAKLHALQLKVGEPITARNTGARRVCERWDSIVPKGIGRRYFEIAAQKSGRNPIANKEAVTQLVFEPPVTTRAALRGKFCKEADEQRSEVTHINWGRGAIKGQKTQSWPLLVHNRA